MPQQTNDLDEYLRSQGFNIPTADPTKAVTGGTPELGTLAPREDTADTGLDDFLRSKGIPIPQATPTIQKANPEQDSFISGDNYFWKFLDVLNTPQQLLYGGIKGATEGAPIIESAIRGAKENITGSQVLEGWGVSELGSVDLPVLGEVTGRGTIGLAMDIFTDPLLLVSKVAKPLELGGKLSRTAKAAAPAGFGGAGQLSFKGFKPTRNAVKFVQDLIVDAPFTLKQASRKFKNLGTVVATKLRQQAEQFGILPEKWGRKITASAEIPRKAQVPLPFKDGGSLIDASEIIAITRAVFPKSEAERAIAKKVSLYHWAQDRILKREGEAKLGTIRMDRQSIDYVTHILTPEAKEVLILSDDLRRFGTRAWKPTHGMQTARKWTGKTIDEINELGREGKLPGFPGIVIDQVFEDDPAKIFFMSALVRERSIVDAEVLMNAAKSVGKRRFTPKTTFDTPLTPEELKTAKEAALKGTYGPFDIDRILKESPGSIRKLSITRTKNERLKPLAEYLNDYYFDADVADHLDNFAMATFDPQVTNSFLQTFDLIQNEWKALTLFPFPAYHMRNAVGNIWNNLLARVKPSKYIQAGDFQRTASTSTKTFKVGGKEYGKAELDDLLFDYGITNQFEAYIDLQKIRIGAERGEDMIRRGAHLESIPGLGHGIKFGMKVGGAVEDNARIAHFFSKLDEGMSATEAALSVKRYLFNYADLTKFEKTWMKRIFPFYAWTRFNIPLQIRGIVDNPNQYASLLDIKNSIEKDVPAPRDEDVIVHKWIKENSSIRTKINADGNPEYFLLGGWLPAADLNDIANMGKTMIDNFGPWKIGPELITNKDLFLGRDIENMPGEKTKFLFVDMPKKVVHGLKQLRFLTELDRFVAAAQTELGVDKQFTSRRGDSLKDTTIRYFFGVKSYEVNKRVQRLRNKRDRQKLLGELRSDIRFNQGMNKELILRKIRNPSER
jgi:hypothetical protein